METPPRTGNPLLGRIPKQLSETKRCFWELMEGMVWNLFCSHGMYQMLISRLSLNLGNIFSAHGIRISSFQILCVHNRRWILKRKGWFPLDSFDRLIIYTDGGSKSSNRRKAPLWVQDLDTPDWAFVVLGEKYANQNATSKITFLGGIRRQLFMKCICHISLQQTIIGSEDSEREGFFWAGIWGLGINSRIPTVFRSDSSTTADQAAGRVVCHSNHLTYVALRSVFQALEAGIGATNLSVEHVLRHAGDVWNEFADFLAKTEAAEGHKLMRQQVNLQVWPKYQVYLPFLLDAAWPRCGIAEKHPRWFWHQTAYPAKSQHTSRAS